MPTNNVSETIPPISLKLRNTTLFLVRHADTPPGVNPHLNAAGQVRANELVRVLGLTGIVEIYATEFFRTQETAQALASHLGLAIKVMEADPADVAQDIRAHHLGHKVLIVGHSNTIPEIISQFGGPAVPAIAPTEFDRLFVATMTQLRRATIEVASAVVKIPEQGTFTLLPLKYGAVN